MIHDSIKTALGAELATQVEEALKGRGKDGKDIDLVVGNDGSHVPADKIEGERSRAISAEKALKAAADALKSIGGSGDPEKIAEDVGVAQETVKTLQATHKEEIQSIQRSTALRLAVAGKVHDPDDLLKLVDLGAVEVDDSGSLKMDVEQLLTPIRQSKPYLFKEQKPAESPNLSGVKPADVTPPPEKPEGDRSRPTIF